MKTKLLFGCAMNALLLGSSLVSGAQAAEDCDRYCDRPSGRYHDPKIDMAMPRQLHIDRNAQKALRDEQQDWYAHHSTPGEMAETRDLNRGAARGAESPPDQRQQMQYQMAQRDYAALRRNYDAQMRDYAAMRDRYRAERAAYRRDPWYTLRGPWIPGPSDDLSGWNIRSQDGRPLGAVTAVARNREGRFEAVRVAVNQGGVAWIDASDLRFDPDSRVATTDIEFGDVRRMGAQRN